MALTINCPHCQAKVRAPESLVGKKVKCPTCKEQFTVEGEAAEAPAAPAPEPIKQEAYTESKPSEAKDDDDADDRDDDQEEEKPRPKRKAASGGFADFIFFRTMITPFAVQVVYFIATGLVFLFGLFQMGVGLFALINGNIVGMLAGMFGGLLGTIVGLVVVRIYCEVLILMFRMYDVAKEIKEELEKRG